jgi:hypothetical protein
VHFEQFVHDPKVGPQNFVNNNNNNNNDDGFQVQRNVGNTNKNNDEDSDGDTMVMEEFQNADNDMLMSGMFV